LADVLELHRRVMKQASGKPAVRDLSSLISAVAQPRMTFEGRDLHPALADKQRRSDSPSSPTIRSSTATSAPVTLPWKLSSY
jgi:hypothetical protein